MRLNLSAIKRNALFLLTCCLSLSAWAVPAGLVSHLSGPLFAQGSSGAVRSLSVNSVVEEGDILVTEKNTFARLKLKDGAEVLLRPASQLRLQKYSYDENKPEADAAVMDLVKGGLRTVTGMIGKRGDRSVYRLEAATATIGIRGTDYDAHLCTGNCGPIPAGLYVDVHGGAVSITNSGGVSIVTEGQRSFIQSRFTPPAPPPPNILPPVFRPPPTVGQPGTQTTGGSCLVR